MFDREGTTSVLDAPAAREPRAHDRASAAPRRERASFDAFDPFDLSFDTSHEAARSDAGEFGTP